MEISISNFFNKYIFEPSSKDLDPSSRTIAWVATLAVGILFLGLVHLGTAATNLIRFRGHIIKSGGEDKALALSSIFS